MTRNDDWNAINQKPLWHLHFICSGKSYAGKAPSPQLWFPWSCLWRKWGKTIKLIHEIGFTDRRFKKKKHGGGTWALPSAQPASDSEAPVNQRLNWKLLWLVQSGALPVISKVIGVMTPFIASMGPSVSAKTPSFPPPPWLLQLLEPGGHAWGTLRRRPECPSLSFESWSSKNFKQPQLLEICISFFGNWNPKQPVWNGCLVKHPFFL